MKRIASGALLFMIVVYLATLHLRAGNLAIGLVNAFAEAAMVGALADWFAVVALFRHPLGIPFWHTAVLPRNKDRIGKSLSRFLLTHFLTREALAERMAAVDVGAEIGRGLMERAPFIADRILRFLPQIAAAAADEDVRRLLRDQVIVRMRAIPLAPLAGRALSVLLVSDTHHLLAGGVLSFVEQLLQDNPGILTGDGRTGESEGWRPFRRLREFVEEKLTAHMQRKFTRHLDEARADPEHRVQRAFEQKLESLAASLQTSPEFREEAERLKEALLEHPLAQEWVEKAWTEICRRLSADASAVDSQTREIVEAILMNLGKILVEEEGIRRKLNAWLRKAAVDFLFLHREELGSLIERRVQTWDAGQISEVLEHAVGRDLQFIRLNGTFIGGAVGVLLFFLRLLLGL
ncbi:MAG TPA: DUF445 domain-containing protein [Candidatus Sulfotelmatobacter sp.]|nr:DUF445 domain-containing protein [Candidatus Sulfotelmatobacter sp.]